MLLWSAIVLVLVTATAVVVERVGFAAALLGLLNWEYFRVMIVVSVLSGIAVTLLSLVLSDVATRRYMRARDVIPLVWAILFEAFGYRQVNSWWGCVGTVQALTGKGGWGVMRRRAFES